MVTEFRRVQVVICEQTRDKGASNECATAVYDPQLTESVIVFRYGSVTYIVTLTNKAAHYSEQIRYRTNKTRKGGKMGVCEVPYANTDFYECCGKRSSTKIIVNGLQDIEIYRITVQNIHRGPL